MGLTPGEQDRLTIFVGAELHDPVDPTEAVALIRDDVHDIARNACVPAPADLLSTTDDERTV